MWYTKILVLFSICITATLGLSQHTLNLSVNYFYERNLPFICLITCEDIAWDVKFTEVASTLSMSVSRLDTDDLPYKNIEGCLRHHYSEVGVLLNAHCGEIEQIIYTASENLWLSANHIWLIVDETENVVNIYRNISIDTVNEHSKSTPNILNTLSSVNISVDADIILAIRDDDQFVFFDIFNFGKVQGGNLTITETGLWDLVDNKELVTKINAYKYYNRWDFGQSILRMVSVATPLPKNFDLKLLSDVQPVPGLSTVTRISSMALMVFAEVHNIKFIHTITDRWLGVYDRNISRVVSSSLYYREQDLTSVLRMLQPELDKISYIHQSLVALETRYYYRIPTTGPGKFENQFFRPLSVGAWYCLLGVSALCGVALILTAKWETRPTPVQYALFSVIASVCQQFYEDEAQTTRSSTGRKLTIFITGLSSVLVYNYYTSSVVSWLLSGPPPSINSLQELVESPLELIFQDVGYTRSWLNNPKYYFNKRNAKDEDDIRRKILSKKRKTPILKPLEEGVAMVKAGGYAYHTETVNADTLIAQTFDQRELCELGSLSSMEKTRLYPAVQKDSPYKEFLTWGLMHLHERGIISCIHRRSIPSPVSCEGSSPRALALGGAAPAFILLAFGFVIATLIMLFERLINNMKNGYKY